MLRSVTLSLVLSVLAAACALVEVPPVPANTFMLKAEVRNTKAYPVEITVRTPAGVLPGAVQPASLLGHTATNVTFDIPLGDDWSIWVDESTVMDDLDVSPEILRQGCALGIELLADGTFTYGCGRFTVP